MAQSVEHLAVDVQMGGRGKLQVRIQKQRLRKFSWRSNIMWLEIRGTVTRHEGKDVCESPDLGGAVGKVR